ncbi:hypothetical protein AC1031_012475 [Aphanomyces cochlioides]|nr:hypothetical protein AC1031_012475 [Aphanomyces cochlioides]
MFIILTIASLPPGLDVPSADEYFLNRGLGIGLGFFGQFIQVLGMAMSFFIPNARLTQAMADSNLLPAFVRVKGQKTTLRAMIVSSIFGYMLCIISYFSDAFQATLQNISIVAASICYASQTFVLLRTSYKTETTGYKSPWEMSIYSRFGCQATQTVSQEEYASIFKFSVMKFNKLRQKKKKSPSSGGGGGGGTSLLTKLSFWTGSKRTSITPIAPGGGGADKKVTT